MTDDRLMAAFRQLGEAVELERIIPLAAVAIRAHRAPLLWLYLPPDAEPDMRRAYLDEVHQHLVELARQVDQARRS